MKKKAISILLFLAMFLFFTPFAIAQEDEEDDFETDETEVVDQGDDEAFGEEDDGSSETEEEKTDEKTEDVPENVVSTEVVSEEQSQEQPEEQSEEKDNTDDTKDESVEDVEPKPAAPAPRTDAGFVFGSYGRVQPYTDLRGGGAKHSNIVAHGSRLEQNSYLELDFGYNFERNKAGVDFKLVTTMAFGGNLFHETGSWDDNAAIRNLFLQADNALVKGLSIWTGSRMYRGDDIHVLDFWPLDDLNTFGGGIKFRNGTLLVAYHSGITTGNQPFLKAEASKATNQYGSGYTTYTSMDRRWFAHSLKVEKILDLGSGFGMKLKGYTEFHHIGSGTANIAKFTLPKGSRTEAAIDVPENTDDLAPEEVVKKYSALNGWLVGAQVGTWGFFGKSSSANLFVRFAKGLAAHNTMSNFALDQNTESGESQRLTLAWNMNLEVGPLGVVFAGYFEDFKNAVDVSYDINDYREMISIIRPVLKVTEGLHLGTELSYQLKRFNGLHGTSELKPGTLKFSIFPMLVMSDGLYDRPQLRFVYTAAMRNKDERKLNSHFGQSYPHAVEHYLGVSAEWWFNLGHRD